MCKKLKKTSSGLILKLSYYFPLFWSTKPKKPTRGYTGTAVKKKYTEINDLFVAKLSGITDLPNEEFPHHLAEFQQNSGRVVRKVKQLQNKFVAAVRAGRRSGGGRQVFKFYELCQNVFGGNAAADEIPGGVETNNVSIGTANEKMEMKDDVKADVLDTETAVQPCEKSSLDSPTPTKRRNLLSDLRDQKLKKRMSNDQQMINIALRELALQEQLIKKISEGESQQASAIKSLSESMTAIGQSLSEGFKNIASAMASQSSVVYQQHPVVSSRVWSPPYRQSHSMPYRLSPKFYSSNEFVDNEDLLTGLNN